LLLDHKANALPEILELSKEPLEKVRTPQNPEFPQKVFGSFQCSLIKTTGARDGTMNVLANALQITLHKTRKRYRLQFSDFRQVLLRKRCHRLTALEIFLRNCRAYLLNFPHNQPSDIVKIMNLPDSAAIQKEDFVSYFQSFRFTQMWVNRRISNFQYLLALNIYSGRSFSDTSQYPFFPWTIKDFESEHPDLGDPATYRDLSLPIGAVGPERLAELQQ
jgi:hypothetical protein